MADFEELRRDANYIGADMLLTDLDVALTFMDIAATSAEPETVERNHDHARHAYEVVSDFLKRLSVDSGKREAIEAKLSVLRQRLLKAGCKL